MAHVPKQLRLTHVGRLSSGKTELDRPGAPPDGWGGSESSAFHHWSGAISKGMERAGADKTKQESGHMEFCRLGLPAVCSSPTAL